ncbi:SIR2 family NAD-dependent protein deacylase [Arthrobacter sp. FW306-06-A]|uniref:SIR2 family NAD-dependent protein deacylase n=1 Tax=Arthrobacter sp. FW306-06-A TaxID=2879621 RepID=UPI001F1C4724|nr:SIR2 family protein [Arthrobacter sp. FW306-06-A]UKA72238.1 SIR2 family protein [Arthrobacter sp. FW306-06-A]
MTEGHVFVTMGDLLNFRSDAFLLPIDRRARPGGRWTNALPALEEALQMQDLASIMEESAFALAPDKWDRESPLPVLTAVPMTGISDADELLPRFRAFLEVATTAVTDRRRVSVNQVSRPVLAMPFFGTGHGGGNIYRGAILRVLLKEAYRHADEAGVDIVFVFQDPAAFALAQQQRREGDTAWAALSSSLLAKAKELGEIARSGRLVPFMGAGISISAGAPTWSELLGRLAKAANLSKPERKALKELSNLDQAAVLRTYFEEKFPGAGDIRFGRTVSEAVNMQQYGLAPSLLACLPSSGAITLNYDTLFEKASKDAGSPRTVIPGEKPDDSTAATHKWLLKLHGSVDQPETIVLTRDDYLGYSATREALSALVKAHLITHHLLFVGFGLADDHFHEIIHDVRRALPAQEAGGRFGSALMLKRDAMQEKLWGKHLNLIDMEDSDSSEFGTAAQARRLEIFLDALIAHTSDSHAFLLAPHYRDGLTDEESALRQALLEVATVSSRGPASSTTSVIHRMLRDLGWDGSAPSS